jgi:hypothetical protein
LVGKNNDRIKNKLKEIYYMRRIENENMSDFLHSSDTGAIYRLQESL